MAPTAQPMTYAEAVAEMFAFTATPEGSIALAVFFFVVGLFFGSYFNVCIFRIPMGLSVSRPRRSFCYRCGSTVRWHDNLPVISWLLLRGRCRSCGSRIGARYALVELLTGFLFAAVHLSTNAAGDPFQFATFWYLAFAGLLVIGTFTDLDHWIIPDEVTIGGAVAALGCSVLIGVLDVQWQGVWTLLTIAGPFPMVWESWNDPLFDQVSAVVLGPIYAGSSTAGAWWMVPVNAALGAAFGSFMLYAIGVVAKVFLKKDAMGLGDVKLFAMIGATLGIAGSVLTLVLASMIGVLFGAVMWGASLVGGKASRILRDGEELLPIGSSADAVPLPDEEEPVLTLADRIVALTPVPESRRRVHHLPFGPSIALAAIILLVFHCQVHRLLAHLFALPMPC